MKKVLICLCLLLSFNFVNASENVEIKNKNLYAFDENVDVNGAYDGIGFIAGSNVSVESTLEYGAIAGANVYFKGISNKDLFIAGTSIDISGSVYRDAYVAGTNVRINGVVKGNVYVYASELIIGEDAKIEGNVKFYGESFKTNGGIIGGKLSYYEGTIYEGTTKYEENIMVTEKQEFNFLDYLKNICFDLLKSLFMFFLIAFAFPKLLKYIRTNYKLENISNVLSLCGSGFVFMFIVPFIASLLLISTFGFSAGIIIMIFAGILIYISSLFFGYLLGILIIKLINKEHNDYLSGLIGISIITILSYIPYLGIFVSTISLFVGFGLLVKMIVNKKNRNI